MLIVPVAPSVGALSKPMRSNVSTGTPVALLPGSMLPEATAKSGDAVTGTVRGFTSPVVADVCCPSCAASEGDASPVFSIAAGDPSADGPSAEGPSLTEGNPSVDGPSSEDPSAKDPSATAASMIDGPSMEDASVEDPSADDDGCVEGRRSVQRNRAIEGRNVRAGRCVRQIARRGGFEQLCSACRQENECHEPEREGVGSSSSMEGPPCGCRARSSAARRGPDVRAAYSLTAAPLPRVA